MDGELVLGVFEDSWNKWRKEFGREIVVGRSASLSGMRSMSMNASLLIYKVAKVIKKSSKD